MNKFSLDSRKEKMLWIQNNTPKIFRPYLRNEVLGEKMIF